MVIEQVVAEEVLVQQVVLVVHRKQVEMVEQEFQQRLQDQQ